MSFQRTPHERRPDADVRDPHLAVADRFGFTIYQVFEKPREQNVISHGAPPRNFGVTLVGLGILMLVVGTDLSPAIHGPAARRAKSAWRPTD